MASRSAPGRGKRTHAPVARSAREAKAKNKAEVAVSCAQVEKVTPSPMVPRPLRKKTAESRGARRPGHTEAKVAARGRALQRTTNVADPDAPVLTPKSGFKLTWGSVGQVRATLAKDGLLFRLNDEGIARHFAAAVAEGKIWQADLASVREVISKVDGCPTAPDDLAQFPTWVRETLLDLAALPRDKLAELYQQASADLAAIAENVRYCEGQLKGIDNRATKKKGSDHLERRFFEYYLRLNTDARDEIVDVLASRSKLQSEALRACERPLFGYIDWHVPWSFRWMPMRYSARDYCPIRHAFLDLPILEIERVEDLYRGEKWADFDRALTQYVDEHKPTDAVRDLLKDHHLLAARAGVLVPALAARDRGELPLFISAVAVQIEGIFEDACRLSGISADDLRNTSLATKLHALRVQKNLAFDYPYFAFHFPRLRNRVAHGRAPTDEVSRIASLLLLDLLYVCEIVKEHPAPCNELVTFLKQRLSGVPSEDLLEFAVLFSETGGQPPDPHYGLDDVFNQATLALDGHALRFTINELVTSGRPEVDSGLRFVAMQLKKLRPNLRSMCEALLKRVAQERVPVFERPAFMAGAAAVLGRPAFSDQAATVRARFLALLRERQTATGSGTSRYVGGDPSVSS